MGASFDPLRVMIPIGGFGDGPPVGDAKRVLSREISWSVADMRMATSRYFSVTDRGLRDQGHAVRTHTSFGSYSTSVLRFGRDRA